jgi:hypothetical protein
MRRRGRIQRTIVAVAVPFAVAVPLAVAVPVAVGVGVLVTVAVAARSRTSVLRAAAEA